LKFSPKLVLICLIVIFYVLIGYFLDNHSEDSFLQRVLAQTDMTESPSLHDSFSAIGTISSLVITVPEYEFNITDAFKVILTGEWNLSVRNGNMTNFEVNFLASPMDGRTPHIHQITNFRPYDNQGPIRLTEDENITIDGIADIKINGMVVWEDAAISISISKGNIFSLDPDDEDTEDHFGDQFVYGIVTRLI
jgi:hypothetical protein